jgi:hypothetical protein
MSYDAFISYSHSADGQLAPAVQSGLQRLARPWYRRHALRVFRDETGLTVNPHLWNSISEAMDQSRYFVLLASPDAAASPWVNQEIAHWVAHHTPETLLPVLTDGALAWDPARGDFDPALSSALPTALAGVYNDEPRHLDLRWARDETDLDLRHSRFRAQIAALAAPIHGVARDDLEGEDIRLHRRARRLAWSAAVALVAFSAAALISAGLAVSYANNADNQRRHAVVLSDRLASSNTKLRQSEATALGNAAEANRNKDEATRNAAEANRNKDQANRNAAEANRNKDQANRNAAEANRNKDEATRNAAEANRNKDEANENAARLTCTNDALRGNLDLLERTALAAKTARVGAHLSTVPEPAPDPNLSEEAKELLRLRSERGDFENRVSWLQGALATIAENAHSAAIAPNSCE